MSGQEKPSETRTREENSHKLEGMVADYYTKKIEEFGASHQGVDWNSTGSQELRFKQLLQVVDATKFYSLNDLGCGYGALFDYMVNDEQAADLEYCGYDLSESMIDAGKSLHNDARCKFILGSTMEKADYTVASGIYNVRMETGDKEWLEYVYDSLERVNEASRRGFAFNMLTSFSDKEKQRDYLYYADPCEFFTLCKKRYSRNVALLHDYGLYEFTILVRKDIG